MSATASSAEPGSAPDSGGFAVRLPNFEGPFDLLLGLISRRRLDVTEVALSVVTDEFIAHIRAGGAEWDLDQASEFLVVAATLLDLKAARLLPSGEVEDEEDLALLEARDLLFARLLQYRAYQQAAAVLAARIATESRWHPRAVSPEERYTRALPDLVLAVGPVELARLAGAALAPRPQPSIAMEHLHAPRVSVREQAGVLVERLRRVRSATFRSLTADAPSRVHVVARFLALLELFRERAVSFDQAAALGELTVRWRGGEAGVVGVSGEYDDAPTEGDAP